MKLHILLVLMVVIIAVHESETTKDKDDPYKPVIRLLKELRKSQKYQHKYQLKQQKYQLKAQKYKNKYKGGGHSGGSWYRESSEESSEEHPYYFEGPNHRPNRPYGFNNNPPIFPSEYPRPGGGGGGNNNNGGDNGASQLPVNIGNIGGGQDQNPLEQFNQGIGSLLQGLSRLSLGQLLFPNN